MLTTERLEIMMRDAHEGYANSIDMLDLLKELESETKRAAAAESALTFKQGQLDACRIYMENADIVIKATRAELDECLKRMANASRMKTRDAQP